MTIRHLIRGAWEDSATFALLFALWAFQGAKGHQPLLCAIAIAAALVRIAYAVAQYRVWRAWERSE